MASANVNGRPRMKIGEVSAKKAPKDRPQIDRAIPFPKAILRGAEATSSLSASLRSPGRRTKNCAGLTRLPLAPVLPSDRENG